ncbi:MAG: hypothetical protein NVS4B11_24680 [Ktedonobacteraceae bacterium]
MAGNIPDLEEILSKKVEYTCSKTLLRTSYDMYPKNAFFEKEVRRLIKPPFPETLPYEARRLLLP